MSEPTPTGRVNKRLSQTVMDMVRSLAVVLAAVGVVTLLVWRPTTPTERVVDVDGSQAVAQAQAGFDVLLPALPEGLDASSARWQPTTASGGAPVWHAGFVVGGSEYLQVSQSTADSPAFIAEQTADGALVGSQAVGDATWDRYEAPD